MGKHRDPLSFLTIAIDRMQRSLRGIYEFSTDPECIYRLSIESAPRDTILPDGTQFIKGERVGILHLYGEHMPVIPASGPSLAWASRMARQLERSAFLLAQHAATEKSLLSVPAFGNDVFLLHTQTNARLLERMGYAVLDAVMPDNVYQSFRMKTVRVWTWLLRRAFNRQSAIIAPADLQYCSIWISRRALLDKYGTPRMPSSV